MPDVMSDRRASPRYALIVAAEITDLASSAKLTGRTSDVSRTGCYVDTLHPPPYGTEVQIRLLNAREVFEVQARIVYVSPGLGMGVMFSTDIPADQLSILDRWLASAARSRR